MGIQTDSTPMEDTKDPATDNVFALYKILASVEQIEEMSAHYLAGNYGYGHAKQALYELLLQKFGDAREKYDYYIAHLEEVDEALAVGAGKAKKVADGVMERLRKKIGY
jgi:tryptophanyl-tRNA synthetase